MEKISRTLESVNIKVKLAAEETVGKHFGEDEDGKNNSDLETNPLIKLELCEESLEVKYTVSQEATNNAKNDCRDLIAKDVLPFAWQIARGMVSNEQSLLVMVTGLSGFQFGL